MRGANSLTWGHVVIRRISVNPQSIRLHFCYLQFHSGEMRAPSFADLFFSLKSKHLITNQSQEIKRRYGKARNYFTEDGQGLYKDIFWKTLVTVFLIFLPAGIFHLSSSLCEK